MLKGKIVLLKRDTNTQRSNTIILNLVNSLMWILRKRDKVLYMHYVQ